jgi:4-amino-4-deoxy-L-arabinose transferase-like glycosyltransferase
LSSRSQGNRPIDREWLRAHLAELLLFCVAIACLFIKLGIGEIESYDEALPVVRALAIEKFGVWLDQSAYALGGFYSATHPPLGVWLIAASRAIFGDSELATRLPAALAGFAAAIGIFRLLRRYADDLIALLLAASFTVCSLFLWYGRHAQLDSLMIALSIWSIVWYQRAVDDGLGKYAALAGLFLGLALMTKFIWALFILPYLVMQALDSRAGRSVKSLMVLVGAALLVSLPWDLYMLTAHPDFLQHIRDSLFGLTAVDKYEPGGSRSVSYYLNQLLVSCPFIIAALWIPFKEELRNDRRIWIALAWLAILLIGLQLASTKMPHFALALLPAGYLISALVLGRLEKTSKVFWSVIALSVFWSLSLQLRMLAKGAQFEFVRPDIVAVAICFALLIALMIFARRRGTTFRAFILLTLVGVFVMTSTAKVLSYREEVFTDGAERIASILRARPQITELSVLHTSMPHDEQTPRLAYYTYGWTQSWIAAKTSTKIAWDKDDVFSRLIMIDPGSSAIVIERDWDRFYVPPAIVTGRMDSIKSTLAQRYTHYDSLRSYDLFYN